MLSLGRISSWRAGNKGHRCPQKNRVACALTRAGGLLYTIKSICKIGTLLLASQMPVPISRRCTVYLSVPIHVFVSVPTHASVSSSVPIHVSIAASTSVSVSLSLSLSLSLSPSLTRRSKTKIHSEEFQYIVDHVLVVLCVDQHMLHFSSHVNAAKSS